MVPVKGSKSFGTFEKKALEHKVTVGNSNECVDGRICIVIGSWQSDVFCSEDDEDGGSNHFLFLRIRGEYYHHA